MLIRENFEHIRKRFGYLRFITREKTSIRIAFVNIFEKLVLDVKTLNICSNLSSPNNLTAYKSLRK